MRSGGALDATKLIPPLQTPTPDGYGHIDTCNVLVLAQGVHVSLEETHLCPRADDELLGAELLHGRMTAAKAGHSYIPHRMVKS
jgi:hypothetical protein